MVFVALSGAKAEVDINWGWVGFMKYVIADCSEKYLSFLKEGWVNRIFTKMARRSLKISYLL